MAGPIDYPEHRQRFGPWIWPAVAAAALLILALTLGLLRSPSGGVSARPSEAKVQQAIQQYLDAMAKGDTETLARNAGCGLFDAVHDKKPEEAIMRITADTFVNTYGTATVKSIDKIVYFSEYQLKVLFTAGVQKVSDTPQGQAELLIHEGTIYVCSAYLRGGNAY